jgi:hypothetical protein
LNCPESLQRELESWEAAGLRACLWWRDDDAVTVTPQLKSLLAAADQAGVSIGIAVVPDKADATLAERLRATPAAIWQHGWRHHNYGGWSGEFGGSRDLSTMVADAKAGKAAMDAVFGSQGWQRVFVPPYHALAMSFKAEMSRLGYLGLSAGSPLTPRFDGLLEVNAEIDITNWHTRTFLGADKVAEMLVKQLVDRRTGPRNRRHEPIGILSHHLVHDKKVFDFLGELFVFLSSSGGVRVLPAGELFKHLVDPESSR